MNPTSRRKLLIIGGSTATMLLFFAAFQLGLRHVLPAAGEYYLEVKLVDASGNSVRTLLNSLDAKETLLIQQIPGRHFPEMQYLILRVNPSGKQKMASALAEKPDAKIVFSIMSKPFSKPTLLNDLMIGEDQILIGAFKEKAQAENSKNFIDKLIRQSQASGLLPEKQIARDKHDDKAN